MKSKNFIVNGLFALFLVAAFAQCDGNNAANTPASNSTPTAGTSELKIAYVEIDSLLNNYNLCKDLNEAMIKKQENVEVTLKEKMKSLDSEVRDFERKYQNNVFTPSGKFCIPMPEPSSKGMSCANVSVKSSAYQSTCISSLPR